MSLHDHSRFKVISKFQHLYNHSFQEFLYTHPALPDTVINAKDAMDYVFNILYPRIQPSVADVASLPALGNTAGDQRIVQDDGDGKAAMYMWSQFDGQGAMQWNKIADIDWGINSVVQALMDQTQYLYVRKMGTTDFDSNTGLQRGVANGEDALYDGQHIYGGDTASQNLILHAANGGSGGFIVFDDDALPINDLGRTFGNATHRWLNGFFGALTVGTGTMTITSDGTTGSITDTNGVIDFDDENLNTTGDTSATNVTGTNSVIAGNLTLSDGSVVSSSGAIDFGDENLSTSGTLSSDVHTITDGVDTLILDSDLGGAGTQSSIVSSLGVINFGGGDFVSVGDITAGDITADSLIIDLTTYDNNGLTTSAGDYTINPVGNVVLDSPVRILAHDITGIAGSSINADTLATLGLSRLVMTDNIIDSDATSILFDKPITPAVTDGESLGTATVGWSDLYMANGASAITQVGGSSITMQTLLAFRDATAGANVGDAIFWDGGKFVASAPDTEIDHGTISGLGDDDHTQYALLAGRAGGQALTGGTLTTQTLTLLDNAVDGNGVIIGASFNPNTIGLDLGASGAEWGDIYTNGQGIGFRAQNDANPTANLGNATGRLAFNPTSGFLEVNDGSAWNKVGNNSYNALFTQVTLLASHNVSSSIDDARNAIWQVVDVTNGEEIMALSITKTATLVTVSADIALPAGSYRLIGIEL